MRWSSKYLLRFSVRQDREFECDLDREVRRLTGEQ